MPLAVYVLGLSIFALGTSEFMISGLLPSIATELAVSIPDAGLLISAFAIGMVIGAPLLAAATLRLPRKATLLALLTAFGLGQVAGALAPGYGPLFASRVISALACAGFWAVAAVTAISLVPRDRRGRAMAVVTGGLTVANIVGVPAGTFLGQHAGWRAAFWAVAALSALAVVGLTLFVPATRQAADQRPRLRVELGVYRDRRIWLALGITACSSAMIFGTFSYLAPLLIDVTGLPDGSVPAVLALFGLGALIGITAGGRLADAHPLGTLYVSTGAAVAALAVLALAAPSAPVTVAAIFVLGVAGFAANPALNIRVFTLAGNAPTLGGASNTAAFNVGNTTGPWLGGLVIGAGLGYPSVAVVSAVLGVVALAGLTLATAVQRRDDRAAGQPVLTAA
ncbi:Cmx/CmrA family chloramphenicol efflux MFS transporter [Amycolatopsis nigrescens]|uniref:Cmx/CmrA family chloramphenicol efflux MFS transporter n=1 Tax=Amycolatopsis nigrescens TaxID=381445 RepID=UPI000376B91A|nr:Cmx/CmrA family chloramphenicol efflux MFS transporter [Amycolatopsis nigrescens]